jgi:hypothetical protein
MLKTVNSMNAASSDFSQALVDILNVHKPAYKSKLTSEYAKRLEEEMCLLDGVKPVAKVQENNDTQSEEELSSVDLEDRKADRDLREINEDEENAAKQDEKLKREREIENNDGLDWWI